MHNYLYLVVSDCILIENNTAGLVSDNNPSEDPEIQGYALLHIYLYHGCMKVVQKLTYVDIGK